MPRKRGSRPIPPHHTRIRKFSEEISFENESVQEQIAAGEKLKKALVAGLEGAKAVEIRKRTWLEFLRQKYGEKKNPLYVWEAYKCVREARFAAWEAFKSEHEVEKWPIPDWVFEYLDECAKGLCKRINSISYVAEVLGFHQKGRTTLFKQFYRALAVDFACVLVDVYRKAGKTTSEAFESAALAANKEYGWPIIKKNKANPKIEANYIADAAHQVKEAYYKYKKIQ